MPDQPLAVALGARFGIARIPSEFLRALAIRLGQMAAGELGVLGGVLFGLVEPPHLDRIHAQRIGEFVHRRFQRKRSDRFARRAHPGIGDRVQIDDLLLDQNIRRRIQVPGRKGALLRVAPVRRGRRHAGVNAARIACRLCLAPRAIRCSAMVRPPTVR